MIRALTLLAILTTAHGLIDAIETMNHATDTKTQYIAGITP